MERVFIHETVTPCDACGGTGVGTDENGTCYGGGCNHGSVFGSVERAEPPDTDRAFFAERAAEMAKAEALAVEAQRRLVVWGAGPCAVASWQRTPSWDDALFVPHAAWTVEYVLVELRNDARPRERSAAAHLARSSAAFRDAATRGLCVPEKLAREWPLPKGVRGRSLSELDDPFAPLLEIRQVGFALTQLLARFQLWAPG